jgi:hypothetical protein
MEITTSRRPTMSSISWSVARLILAALHSFLHLWQGGGGDTVQLYRIPNVLWGSVNSEDHHQLRVAFPALYRDNHGSPRPVPEERLREWYQDLVLPAARETVPQSAVYWPAGFDVEVWRVTRPHGGRHQSYVDVPSLHLLEFQHALMNRCDNGPHDWTAGAFFIHELRGMKHRTKHAMDDVDDPEPFETFMRAFDMDLVQANCHQYYVDVGLDIGLDDHVVLWRHDAHAAILSHVLATPLDDARRRVASPRCHRDLTAHLTDLAGFRYDTQNIQAPIPYVQAYVSEKGPTYAAGGDFAAKNIAPRTLLRAVKKSNTDWSASIVKTFETSSQAQDGVARIEARVRLSDLQSAGVPHLSNLTALGVRPWIVLVKREKWW